MDEVMLKQLELTTFMLYNMKTYLDQEKYSMITHVSESECCPKPITFPLPLF